MNQENLKVPTEASTAVANDILSIILEVALPEQASLIEEFIGFIEDVGSGSDQLSQITSQLSGIEAYIKGLPLQTANMVHYTGAIAVANQTVNNMIGFLPLGQTEAQLLQLLPTLSDNDFISLNSFISRGAGNAPADYYSLINNLIYYAYNNSIGNLSAQPYLGIGNCYANDLFNNTNSANGYTTANIYDLVSPHILLATTVCGVAATVCNYGAQVLTALQVANNNNLYGPHVQTSTIESIQSNLADTQIVNDLTMDVNKNIPFYSDLMPYISYNAAPVGICGNAFTVFNYICGAGNVSIMNYRTNQGTNYLIPSSQNELVVYTQTPDYWWATFEGMNTNSFATQSLINFATSGNRYMSALVEGRSGIVALTAVTPGTQNSSKDITLLAQCSTQQTTAPYNYVFLMQWGGQAVVNNISWGDDYSPGFFSIDTTDADQWWVITPQ